MPDIISLNTPSLPTGDSACTDNFSKINMTSSGKSLFYFGIYGVCAGMLFLIIPNTIISLTYLPNLPNGWTRVIGLLALIIGTYDIVCGRADLKPFIQASIFTRLGFALATAMLFFSGELPLAIFLIGLVDALGAVWTILALKSEKRKW